MRTHTALAALVLLALSALYLPTLAGADTPAQLKLLVVDKTGAPLPAATVTVYTLDGKPGRTVTTDSKGYASFTTLPAGVAQLRVQFPGFRPFDEKATLKRGDNAQTVTLQLAPFTENVTVTATPSAVVGS